MEQDVNFAAIWKQPKIPVVYRRSSNQPLMIRLSYAPDNKIWLKGSARNRPKWIKANGCWEVPKAWFDEIIEKSLVRFGRVYVIQAYRAQEKCAPACWDAKGYDCECSCMGKNHGTRSAGAWRIVSETLAVKWHERELACRLIERRNSP